jgi:hypothetical protein
VAARDLENLTQDTRTPLLISQQKTPRLSLRLSGDHASATEQRQTVVPPEVVNICCPFSGSGSLSVGAD